MNLNHIIIFRLSFSLIFMSVIDNSMLIIMLIIREGHCSWASPSGTILMGGTYSKKTSEKIQEDGTSSYSFDLKYDT